MTRREVVLLSGLLALLGAKRFMGAEGHFVAWAVSPDAPGLSVTRPFDGHSRATC